MSIAPSMTKVFSIGLMVLGAGAAHGRAASSGSGQDYPARPIRIVSSEPGGSNDYAARLMVPGLTASLKQNVVVENRPGIIAAEIVSKAAADGYTLLAAGGSFVLGPLLRTMPYDVLRDFAPVTLAVTSPSIVVVHPSSPIKSIRDLIDTAKARPGELNYSSASAGSANHLGSELFKAMANVNIVRVPYKGAGPALSALIAAEVQVSFASAGSAMPHIKSGRVRALAVTSAKPTALAPGLPTVASAGLPGYEAAVINGVHAPAKTPRAIVNRLNQAIVRVLNEPDVKEKFFQSGSDVMGTTAEASLAAIKAEIARMGKVIKDAGIREE
jgi:tripartite-type tricarboxylate transporter receptor subunit TctC